MTRSAIIVLVGALLTAGCAAAGGEPASEITPATAHLLAERVAYRGAEGAGQQHYAWTRYALFTLWWVVMFSAPLEYALWPRDNLAVTVVGVAEAATRSSERRRSRGTDTSCTT